MDERMPTEVDADTWIWADETDDYIDNLDDRYLEYDLDELGSGKWMLFVKTDDLNEIWTKIRDLTVTDQLGCGAKSATMKPNSKARNSNEKLICVYVSEASDFVEVASVLWKLFQNNLVPPYQKSVPFKTDSATLAGNYVKDTNRPVSMYKLFPKEIDGKSLEEFIDYFRKKYLKM